MKDPHDIIVKPHITEKSLGLSYGDKKVTDIELVQRKYTFVVANTANKIEIKSALEFIYNEGRKEKEKILITSVRTIKVLGKKRRVGGRKPGYKPDFKKAIVTLDKGQMLEDYGA